MKPLTDEAVRQRAVSSVGETLLVEAAAGTGKTAIIAGRLTLLLAEGRAPGSIAAITFTELAASELAQRVGRYVGDLLRDEMPAPLRSALPGGLSLEQRAHLEAAAADLDQLTTTTIHAFCQTIITACAVEADLDPGAKVLDAPAADSAFEQVFSAWLTQRLTGPARDRDAIATLSKADPRRVTATLRALARFRLQHRDAKTLPLDWSGRPDDDLDRAVQAMEEWFGAQVAEPKTEALLNDLKTLASFYSGSFAQEAAFVALWRLSQPPKLASMRRWSAELLKPRLKSAWQKVAGREDGSRLVGEMDLHFADVDRAYRIVAGRIAQALVSILGDELDEVLNAYRAFKREAAVLDFDDLLECARNLVRGHDEVRRALGEQYRHILIDEFQDTDPIQAEIFFRIAATSEPIDWENANLREGALFLVGDPKQAIYRFRGADVGAYAKARDALLRQWPENLLRISANFRSRPAILDHVNLCFRAPLNGAGQPGYVALEPTLEPPDHGLPCAAKIAVESMPGARAEDFRRAEAEVVAEACARLIGSIEVTDDHGVRGPLRAGGIALLAPTGTDLWLYERALAERQVPFVSQAGRGFFRRQETQDLLALTRALADPRDTLALGALLRGPLVGLTDEELLDISVALAQSGEDRRPVLSLFTDPNSVSHTNARRALAILKDLRSRSRSTTPALLLAEAVERLCVRPILAARGGERSARAWANVEAFLERSRGYGVYGLKAFAQDLTREWSQSAPATEGRVDAEGEAVEIVTIHSAKGLEWPVVIPINTATRIRAPEEFVHRMSDNTLHWVVGDVAPPDLLLARQLEEESLARERERLWYVACTRARELLLVPYADAADQKSWARIIDLNVARLPTWDVECFERVALDRDQPGDNEQTEAVFATQQRRIDDLARPIIWKNPSRHDEDRREVQSSVESEVIESMEAPAPVGAGRVRGLVLHKLLEEVLTGELGERDDMVARADVLIRQLVTGEADGAALPSPDEMATTVQRTLQLPEIVALRAQLVPEASLFAMLAERTALSGRADAIAMENGVTSVVIDWKSDVAPNESTLTEHVGQLIAYLEVCDAKRGMLVYMTAGKVRWVER